jgi:hypothetical protein
MQVCAMGRGVSGFQRNQPVELGAYVGHAARNHDTAGMSTGLLGIDHAHHTQRPRSDRRIRTGCRALARPAAWANTNIPEARRADVACTARWHPPIGQCLQRRDQVDDAKKSDSHVNSRKVRD